MPKTSPRSKGNQPEETEGSIARRYEGGHGAPYSPVTPETSSPGAPAIDEMKSRDRQDGKTDARRERREGEPQSGPPEPEDSPAAQSGRAPARHKSLPQGSQRQRRSHRTLQ
jgi:hypothetical protein